MNTLKAYTDKNHEFKKQIHKDYLQDSQYLLHYIKIFILFISKPLYYLILNLKKD